MSIKENGIVNFRLGIYGGTFDPVHKGHEYAALQFYRFYNLNELLIIPVFVPPHKQTQTSPAKDRLNMCRLAFGGDAFKAKDMNITVSDMEIMRGEISYTFDTLVKIKEIYGAGCEILFLIGADMFLCLDKWYKYEDLFKLCSFVVTKRSESDATAESEEKMNKLKDRFANDFGAKIEMTDIKFLDISSTRIRNTLKRAGVSEFVSPDVMKFIEDNKLYR